MARKSLATTRSASASSSTGGKGWIITLAVLTALAIVTGSSLGSYLVSKVEKVVDEKKKEEQAKASHALTYSGDIRLKSLAPVVANLSGSGDSWIRVESSIVFDNGALQNPDVTAAEIRQDIVAYLRTVSLSQIEGASGLQHVREDLNERAVLRSKGQVREVIIETLVVQ